MARELAARHTFWLFAAVFCVAAATNAWINWREPWPRALPAIGYATAALMCVLATRMRGERADRALFAAGVTGVVLIAITALIYGWGFNGLAMGFYAIVTLVFAAFFSVRAGMAMAALCIGITALLGWAEHRHWIVGVPAVGETMLVRRWVTLTLMILVSLAVGLLTVRLIAHWLDTARERESRFLTLLGIATDSYWEMDAQFVVTEVWRRSVNGEFLPVAQPKQRPWELPGMRYDDGALERNLADLQARRPFRDLHVCFPRADGALHHELVSGSPRVDGDGRFLGYWGVSRDVTAEFGARAELRSAEDTARESQALLRQLVQTSPDIITLSEMSSGRYVMVSAMFERVTGHPLNSVIGRTAAEIGIWRRPEDRERLLGELRTSGRVQDVVLEFCTRDGRPLPMRCSASLFDARGQRYLVVIARDMSEPERARREREAILENASIGIALTRDRRFVMVNRRFETLFGWPPGGLVGQSGSVVWLDAADYAEIGQRFGPPLARGEQIVVERPMRRRDGSRFIGRCIAKGVDPQRPAEGGTIWIVDDVTERREVERALAQARDDAEAASRAKSAFLANTSHEIRTPLNGLLGLARLARQGGVNEAQRQSYLDQIADSAEILSAIISDILDLSKIEAGKLEINVADFDLHALLHALQHAYAALAEARSLTLGLQIAPDVAVHVRGDATRLRQILTNFLTNALKFTVRGSVNLRVKTGADARLRFEVADTGPGIDLATQARLFQPFTQADDSITRRFGGTGLGLSICRELALLMDGEVGLDSELGQGSTFHVELPMPAAAAPPAATAGGVPGSSPLAGAHVLLVEDNAVNLMVAQAILEQWGLRVETATHGQEALDAVARANQRADAFDAVLMDVQMPGMSGFEATRRLRLEHPSSSLPVIALTAAALVSERQQALALGMNDFLTKPIDSERLHAVLAHWIRRA